MITSSISEGGIVRKIEKEEYKMDRIIRRAMSGALKVGVRISYDDFWLC